MANATSCIDPVNASLALWNQNVCDIEYLDLPIAHTVHLLIAGFYVVSGLAGVLFNLLLLVVHILLHDVLLDSSGIFLTNFICASFGVAFLQAPISASSSIAGRWFFGEFACTLYGFVGFTFGIGLIFSLGLLILDRHMEMSRKTTEKPLSTCSCLLLVIVKWLFVLLITVPPLTEKFGRYHLEPAGTACTIDYWHGNHRNYNAYILSVVVFAFVIPISIMLYMLVRIVRCTQTNEGWSLNSLQHHKASTKLSGYLLIAELVCWTPYSVLVLWTVVFPPSTINVYYTFIPSVFAKISPFVGAVMVWGFVPRVNAACRYVISGRKGARPSTLINNTKEAMEMEVVEPLKLVQED